MQYIIDGEVIDTYGGDYTYRDVFYEIEDGEYVFYEVVYGNGVISSKTEIITDKEEIKELMDLI